MLSLALTALAARPNHPFAYLATPGAADLIGRIALGVGTLSVAADCVAYAADRRSWINIITTVMSNMIALFATGIGPQMGAAIFDTHMIILDTILPGDRSLPKS